MRISSNHFLGRVCIFKASQAETEEDYKEELDKAIEFFKEAALESLDNKSNPSKFFLPFYRSFHTILFKKHEAKKQVDRYLAEAKTEIRDSKSKELLFEAVENLANALNELKNFEKLDLEVKKGELNFYRQYCDRATELMIENEEKALFAIETMKKGLPILDRNLKELLKEIQKKAKIVCKEAKLTDTEEITCAVSKEVQKWEIGSQKEITQNIEDLIENFIFKMLNLSAYERIFREIDGISTEKDLVKQYKIVSRLVGLIPIFSSMPDDVIQIIKTIKDNTEEIKGEINKIIEKLDGITN